MDPYKVLGVERGADEETIKKAYKKLVKKYHPDRYINSPMADMASEKMKEINLAYDMLTGKNQNTQQSTGNPYGAYRGGGYTAGQPSFQSVRMLISMGQVSMAESMLASLPKTAEWYYLYGLIYMRRGWYEKAVEYITHAAELEPNNVEYRNTLNNINNRNQSYTRAYHSGGYGNSDCSGCISFLPWIICCPCDCNCCC